MATNKDKMMIKDWKLEIITAGGAAEAFRMVDKDAQSVPEEEGAERQEKVLRLPSSRKEKNENQNQNY